MSFAVVGGFFRSPNICRCQRQMDRQIFCSKCRSTIFCNNEVIEDWFRITFFPSEPWTQPPLYFALEIRFLPYHNHKGIKMGLRLFFRDEFCFWICIIIGYDVLFICVWKSRIYSSRIFIINQLKLNPRTECIKQFSTGKNLISWLYRSFCLVFLYVFLLY